jgi:hypothetical protein
MLDSKLLRQARLDALKRAYIPSELKKKYKITITKEGKLMFSKKDDMEEAR